MLFELLRLENNPYSSCDQYMKPEILLYELHLNKMNSMGLLYAVKINARPGVCIDVRYTESYIQFSIFYSNT